MAAPVDWQMTRKKVKQRGQYLLETGQWSDCRFIVGTDPHQQVLEGHKLFLAMSSPVFEAMFFGGMAEKDPISIQDVQPDAFKALLEYIYTDKINLNSFDQACELCYAAKKYMLPHLVEECTKYIWSDLYPRNACRAYEFAKLFEEPILMEKCLQIICTQTKEVLSESSFDDVELSTIIAVFDQEHLNIETELDLFNALTRYSSRQTTQCAGVKVPRLDGIASPSTDNNPLHPTLRDAIMKIRFLTLSPQQFAEGPASSNLLSQSEKFAILMNISSPSIDIPMPDGFSTSTVSRRKHIKISSRTDIMQNNNDIQRTILNNKFNAIPSTSLIPNAPTSESRKFYCIRDLIQQTNIFNQSVLDCSVTFTVDKNICIYGIQIPSQISGEIGDHPPPVGNFNSYTELLYAHLLDADGSRLTYTHFTSRVNYSSVIDISFNRPIYIQRNKLYKVGVVLNKTGHYPVGTYTLRSSCNSVIFTFGPIVEPIRDLVRSIIFTVS